MTVLYYCGSMHYGNTVLLRQYCSTVAILYYYWQYGTTVGSTVLLLAVLHYYWQYCSTVAILYYCGNTVLLWQYCTTMAILSFYGSGILVVLVASLYLTYDVSIISLQ